MRTTTLRSVRPVFACFSGTNLFDFRENRSNPRSHTHTPTWQIPDLTIFWKKKVNLRESSWCASIILNIWKLCFKVRNCWIPSILARRNVPRSSNLSLTNAGFLLCQKGMSNKILVPFSVSSPPPFYPEHFFLSGKQGIANNRDMRRVFLGVLSVFG